MHRNACKSSCKGNYKNFTISVKIGVARQVLVKNSPISNLTKNQFSGFGFFSCLRFDGRDYISFHEDSGKTVLRYWL